MWHVKYQIGTHRCSTLGSGPEALTSQLQTQRTEWRLHPLHKAIGLRVEPSCVFFCLKPYFETSCVSRSLSELDLTLNLNIVGALRCKGKASPKASPKAETQRAPNPPRPWLIWRKKTMKLQTGFRASVNIKYTGCGIQVLRSIEYLVRLKACVSFVGALPRNSHTVWRRLYWSSFLWTQSWPAVESLEPW